MTPATQARALAARIDAGEHPELPPADALRLLADQLDASHRIDATPDCPALVVMQAEAGPVVLERALRALRGAATAETVS